ncbi:head-tail adaptor protein [Phaeobacter italicus]|uniref:phage head completion protein n=1 Tax=Phaeobacter italicus TaxID=481446 RepID=UPI001C9800F0|nr:head-tail adaptor protein [Phaeobacter italicus]MBY5976726.1 head-tail adaptor protein [Phaeobacter italicus]
MHLIERVAFDELDGTSDGLGGKTLLAVERFTTRAKFTFLRGGEKVQAGRLSGTQAIVATVRKSESTADIGTDGTTRWQLRDTASGTVYNIRAVEPNRDKPRQYLDFICESGA